MSRPAIAVHAVSKRFRRGGQSDLTRDLLARLLRRSSKADRPDSFWSLRDVSFDVAPGEAFGVIGPNGAGKSTLLKLLAGILRPDAGSLDVASPVSALIELGAGFHGDLSGRENIYLNAAILGMSRRDVNARFDSIVEFAGIGDALDRPVKWYSSGMYARLGFAVAVHVNPRVLLVDEVLSVGDRAFRARCMARMNEFLRDGVAVVFVSHDVASVQRFCRRALVLKDGANSFLGPAAEAVLHYNDACLAPHSTTPHGEAAGVRVSGLRLTDAAGHPAARLRPGSRVQVEFAVEFDLDIPNPSYGLSLLRLDDHMTLFETSSSRLGLVAPSARRGDHHDVCCALTLNVPPGRYAIGLHVRDRDGVAYLMHDLHAAPVHVEGLASSGGMVHLDPHIQVAAVGVCVPDSDSPSMPRHLANV